MHITLTEAAKAYMDEKGIKTLTITQDFVSSGCSGGLPNIEVWTHGPNERQAEAFSAHEVEGIAIFVKNNIVPKTDDGLTVTTTGILRKVLSVNGVQIDAL